MIQNFYSEMGHPDVIHVRKTESKPDFHFGKVFDDRSEFATCISGRFLDFVIVFFNQFVRRHGDRSGSFFLKILNILIV